MPITLSMPSTLSERTGKDRLEIEAESLKELFEKAEQLCPGFRSYVYSASGQVRSSLYIYVNGQYHSSLAKSLPEGAKVELAYRISGGCLLADSKRGREGKRGHSKYRQG